jgi:hypothetical protein
MATPRLRAARILQDLGMTVTGVCRERGLARCVFYRALDGDPASVTRARRLLGDELAAALGIAPGSGDRGPTVPAASCDRARTADRHARRSRTSTGGNAKSELIDGRCSSGDAPDAAPKPADVEQLVEPHVPDGRGGAARGVPARKLAKARRARVPHRTSSDLQLDEARGNEPRSLAGGRVRHPRRVRSRAA